MVSHQLLKKGPVFDLDSHQLLKAHMDVGEK